MGMPKKRVRPQKPKNMGNSAYAEAMREIRRSSATELHRTPKNYRRADFRKSAQRGVWE